MDFIQRNQLVISAAVVSLLMVSISLVYTYGERNLEERASAAGSSRIEFEDKVAPESGVVLPVVWGDLGRKLIESGVIDAEKFESIYAQRGGLGAEEKKFLYGSENGKISMNRENAGFLLNVLWGFGLGNKNPVLEKGPMMNPEYGGAGRFASTGGWSIAEGAPMDHYSYHKFVSLTADQQKKVDDVSKNIYRPCCGNSVYFPDCNHGMAMLGLLELMAAQGVSESDMYKYALAVNAYWFPDTYVTIARYFQMKGVGWNDVDPKIVLGSGFSSAGGIRKISAEVGPEQGSGGGSCGV